MLVYKCTQESSTIRRFGSISQATSNYVQYSSTYARVNAYEPIRPSPFMHYPYVVVTNIVVHLLIVSQRSTLRGLFLLTFSLPVPDHIGARCPRPCRPSRSVFCDRSSQVNPTQTQRGRKPNPEQVFPPSPDQGQRKCNCVIRITQHSIRVWSRTLVLFPLVHANDQASLPRTFSYSLGLPVLQPSTILQATVDVYHRAGLHLTLRDFARL